MKFRRWHRWLAIPAAIFMLIISATGVLLHLDMIRVGSSPPGFEEPPPGGDTVQLPANDVLAAMVVRGADAARRERGIPVRSIQIDFGGPRPMVVAGAGGPPGSPQIKIDALTGERIVELPPPADFHFVLQNIHAGYIAGWPGRIVSILSGLALLVLSVTGFQMWWDMRKRGKKKGFFWK